MAPAPIRLLIVDDSRETCDILKNYFDLSGDIEVCGTAHDGEEALFHIGRCQPDVVLLDLIMPKLDGLGVLDRLSQAPLAKRPGIIVTSAVGQERFTSAALSMGADYYMIKPCDLADLHARIRTVGTLRQNQQAPPRSQEQTQPPPSRKLPDTAALISRSLLELGIPSHLLGFRYCAEAVALLLWQDRPHSMVKGVYAELSTRFETTPECVEGAMRKVIRRAWESERQAIHTLTGGAGDTPPSNGRFLTSLAQHIRWNQEGGDSFGRDANVI